MSLRQENGSIEGLQDSVDGNVLCFLKPDKNGYDGYSCCKLAEMSNDSKVPIQELRKELSLILELGEDINSDCLTIPQGRLRELPGGPDVKYPAIHWALIHRHMPLLLDVIHLGGDVNVVDSKTKCTPLQLAVSIIPHWVEGIQVLLQYHADVHQVSFDGLSLIQLALKNRCNFKISSSLFCCLINAGCVLDGDSALTLMKMYPSLTYSNSFNQQVSLVHQATSDFDDYEGTLTMDFSPLISSPNYKEVQVLQRISRLENPDVIDHPLVKVFLTLKWSCMKKYHLLILVFYLVYIILMTSNIIMGLSEDDRYVKSSENKTVDILSNDAIVFPDELHEVIGDSPPFPLKASCPSGSCFTSTFYVTLILYIVNVLYTLSVICSLFRVGISCLLYFYFYLDCAVVSFAYIVLSCYLNIVMVPGLRHFEALLLLLLWTKFLFVFGQIPSLGIYVAMLSKVAKDILRFLCVYSILVMAFAMAFSVLFYDKDSFKSPFLAILKTMAMMTGEYDFDALFVETKPMAPGTVHIIFACFVIFVTIVLLNLLIGLAVNDIQKIKQDSEGVSMRMQIDLLHGFEEFFTHPIVTCFSPHKVLGHMRRKMRVSHHLENNKLILHLSDYDLSKEYVTKRQVVKTETCSCSRCHVVGACFILIWKKIETLFRFLFFTPNADEFPYLLTSDLLKETIRKHMTEMSDHVSKHIMMHRRNLKTRDAANTKEIKLERDIEELKQLVKSLINVQNSRRTL